MNIFGTSCCDGSDVAVLISQTQNQSATAGVTDFTGILEQNGVPVATTTDTNGLIERTGPLAPAGQRDLWAYATGGLSSYVAYSPTFDKAWCFGAVPSVQYSTDGGATFSACVFDVAPIAGVVIGYNSTVVVAIAYNLVAWTSDDGINFVKCPTNAPGTPNGWDIEWFAAAGLFISPCTVGIMTSPDGTVWTTRVTGTANSALARSNSTTCVVTCENAPYAMYSTDGITWVNTPTPFPAVVRACTWSEERGLWLAGLFASGAAYTSTNGRSWTAVGSLFSAGLAGNSLIWVADGINRWYATVVDSFGNYSLASSASATAAFQYTTLDGAAVNGPCYAIAYNASRNRFILGLGATPFVAYNTLRTLDIKALSDNIRVRGRPVAVSVYSTYADTTCNNTAVETDISTSASSIGSLFLQDDQPLGMRVSIAMILKATSVAGDTLTIRVYGGLTGTTLLYTHTIVIPALAANLIVSMESDLTVRATTLQVNSKDSINASFVTGVPAYTRTIGNTLKVTAQWAGAVSQCVMNQLTVGAQFRNGA